MRNGIPTKKQTKEADAKMMAKLFRSKQAAQEERGVELANTAAQQERHRREERKARSEAHKQRAAQAREKALENEAQKGKADFVLSDYLTKGKPSEPLRKVAESDHSQVVESPCVVQSSGDASRILDALKSSGNGLTRSQIRRGVFGDNMKAGDVRAMLDELLIQGLVRFQQVETLGRYAELWQIECE